MFERRREGLFPVGLYFIDRLISSPRPGAMHVQHYNDVIMSGVAPQITSLTIVYPTVYSGADLRKKSKLRVTGLCGGNSPVAGEFPAQRASKMEHVSIR